MCCFSGPVAEVAETNIFVRAAAHGRQLLAYQLRLRATGATAMILPLPVPPGGREDAVRFLDLRSYPDFFVDLQKPFVHAERTAAGGGAQTLSLPETLVVHRVGSFDASFVPTIDDFERLDPRFRLAPAVWAALPRYADWGFAVFVLHALAPDDATKIEPMALEFPRRDPATLFFPTVHVHDGVVHARADFDHNLFFQLAADDDGDRHDEPQVAVGARVRGTASSHQAAREFTSPLRARGLLDEARPIWMTRLAGALPNHDAFVLGARAADAELEALAAWQRAPRPLPPSEASPLVRRLALSQLADDPSPAAVAAGAALVELLPWQQQVVGYGAGMKYGPPEFIHQLGEPLDDRATVYVLGALLCHLLSGRLPFGDNLGAYVGHLQQAPPPLDGPLAPLVARALQKDPAQRGTLAAFAAALAP